MVRPPRRLDWLRIRTRDKGAIREGLPEMGNQLRSRWGCPDDGDMDDRLKFFVSQFFGACFINSEKRDRSKKNSAALPV